MKLAEQGRLFCGLILICSNFLLGAKILAAQSAKIEKSDRQCPQELVDLANLMTSNISNYGNRVIQKSSVYSHKLDFLPTYIVTASEAEIKAVSGNRFTSATNDIPDNVPQIFFTTLERQYPNKQRMIEAQNYHWLILTQTDSGWKLVMALTRFGYPQGDKWVISPPRDTTNSVIGQAVNLWLKDCQYGTLR